MDKTEKWWESVVNGSWKGYENFYTLKQDIGVFKKTSCFAILIVRNY